MCIIRVRGEGCWSCEVNMTNSELLYDIELCVCLCVYNLRRRWPKMQSKRSCTTRIGICSCRASGPSLDRHYMGAWEHTCTIIVTVVYTRIMRDTAQPESA